MEAAGMVTLERQNFRLPSHVLERSPRPNRNLRQSGLFNSCSSEESVMSKIAPLLAVLMLAYPGGVAHAQGTTSTVGSYSGPFTQSFTVPNSGINTTPSSTAGLGNGSNPGIGDRSGASIRANTGLDANGLCNGARSTFGNNTPSC